MDDPTCSRDLSRSFKLAVPLQFLSKLSDGDGLGQRSQRWELDSSIARQFYTEGADVAAVANERVMLGTP